MLDGRVLSSLVNVSAAQVFSTSQAPPSSGLTSEDSFQLRTSAIRYLWEIPVGRRVPALYVRALKIARIGTAWRSWMGIRVEIFRACGINFGMSCTCNVRFVSAEPRRNLSEFVGGKVDAHNRAGAYGRYLRACANLHGGPGRRPITFIPLSLLREAWNACTECEREGVRTCVTNAYMYNCEWRGGGTRNKERKTRAAMRDDTMRNDDILREHTRGQRKKAREREREGSHSIYNRRYLLRKMLFVFLRISCYFIPVDNPV